MGVWSLPDERKRLKSLPDLSKWITNNVTTMNRMFCRCSSLISLSDISNFSIKNVTGMFYGYHNLLNSYH